mmetsp:Transcript_10821/g.13694  ORF Transcript_10821/g.13694 Transcript_10821/m.13694 type:complete len:246 (+) Transcript_10821:128-865(+)
MNEKTALIAENVKQKVTETGKIVEGQMKEFVEMAKNGSTSIRGLALISGFALIISSIYEIFSNAFHFHPTAVLIAFYSLFMGGVAVAMEVDPQALPYGEKIRAWLIKYIGFVQLSTGRGMFYLVAGSLELTQDNLQATIIGFFTVLIALAYIVVGRRAVGKVKKIRQEVFPPRVLKEKFNSFDTNGDGHLDFKEFHELLLSLDVDITFQGAEMIFVSLDRDMQGGLSYEEFEKFWSEDPLTMIPV